jgi:hypothetical protein
MFHQNIPDDISWDPGSNETSSDPQIFLHFAVGSFVMHVGSHK